MGAHRKTYLARSRWSALVLVGALAALVGCAPVASGGSAPTPATLTFSAAIESPVTYVAAAKKCLPSNTYDKPGPIRFRALLLATYGTNVGGKTVFTGITRPCDGTITEHAEGRALDWGMDYRVAAMRADGQTVLDWLFATDRYGNTFAMAKRLGIMYVIWDKKIYGSWSDYKAAPYACGAGTDPTACHIDHMHFSFSWPGANARTSFFTGKVAAGTGATTGHATR